MERRRWHAHARGLEGARERSLGLPVLRFLACALALLAIGAAPTVSSKAHAHPNGRTPSGKSNPSVRAQIEEYKKLQLSRLQANASARTCRTSRLDFPEGNAVVLTDADGKPLPLELLGLQQYVLQLDPSEDPSEVIARFKKLAKKGDNLSSFIQKERLDANAAKLRVLVDRMSKASPGEFPKPLSTTLIYENYISPEPSSEVRLFGKTYVVFINDRLLDFTTWMADLIHEMTIPVDAADTARRFPNSEQEQAAKIALAAPRLRELLMHYYYDCPISVTRPSRFALRLREYMEMFVLAHEYAHASYDHLSLPSQFGDTLNVEERREKALTMWMNELQADLFAVNVTLNKLHVESEDDSHLWLVTAGAFYLASIEVLERGRLVQQEGSAAADGVAAENAERFDKLILAMKPFPMSLAASKRYKPDASTSPVIDSLSDLQHPPAFSRASVLLTGLNTGLVRSGKLSKEQAESFRFGVSMVQEMLFLFEGAKAGLCEH